MISHSHALELITRCNKSLILFYAIYGAFHYYWPDEIAEYLSC